VHDLGSNPDRPVQPVRLTRRSGLRLAGLGALLSVAGSGIQKASAQDASPSASPNANCIADSAGNSATAARWFTEVLNQKKFEILEEILDPNVELDPGAFSAMTGAARVNQMLGDLLGAFPDAAYTIEDTLVDGDRVVMRWSGTGTHAGDYAGIPATGEPRRWSGIHVFHFACGRITNIWAEADILAQLGLVDDVPATPVPFAGETGSPGPACELSSPEEMERIARIWQGVWTSHDLANYDDVVSPDEIHHFGVRSDTVGLAALEHSLEGFFTAFPDVHATMEDIVVDGDRVAFRYTDSGTNTGRFFGAPPTGNPVTWTGINILRIQCGMVVESWAEVDGLGLWRQLGLLEDSGAPTPA
jgi:steroid delta-isomerase-like uncharacterized protein